MAHLEHLSDRTDQKRPASQENLPPYICKEKTLTAAAVIERPTVWVSSQFPETIENALGHEFNVILNKSNREMTSQELAAALQISDALLLPAKEAAKISSRHLENLQQRHNPRAKIIATYGPGTSYGSGTHRDDNSIDIKALARHNITLAKTNTTSPDPQTLAIDQTIDLIWRVSQLSGHASPKSHFDLWDDLYPTAKSKRQLLGKTFGIIGFNHRGQAVAERVHREFGMEVLAYDADPIPSQAITSTHAQACRNMEDLLSSVDFLLIHQDNKIDNANTRSSDPFGAWHLNHMKPTAYLIHAAPHLILDQKALLQALWFETIAGAGLYIESEKSFGKGNGGDLAQLDACKNAVVASLSREHHLNTDALRAAHNIKDFFHGDMSSDMTLKV